MLYQLEIKQVVDYPRCRIYRDFLRTLMNDRDIRTNGSSYLFYYMTLCSYANFRTSYRKLEGVSYLIGPGEWVCTTEELSEWFRTRFQHQAVIHYGLPAVKTLPYIYPLRAWQPNQVSDYRLAQK